MNSKIKMQFDPDIAKELNVNCAIMYSNIEFWVEHNKANERNGHDGFYWTYNSMKAFTELFPFWTEKQIRTILDTLEDKGYIKTGNYNEHQYDRTKWYTSIRPNGQMETTSTANAIAEVGEPIPDNKPDIINSDDKLTAKAEDVIAKLYYEVIKAFGLPVRNHNNVKSAIAKMKTEADEQSLVQYLEFMRDRFQDLEYQYKPEINEALDIHAKRKSIISSVQRESNKRMRGKALVI